jgi:hypothetical protein
MVLQEHEAGVSYYQPGGTAMEQLRNQKLAIG